MNTNYLLYYHTRSHCESTSLVITVLQGTPRRNEKCENSRENGNMEQSIERISCYATLLSLICQIYCSSKLASNDPVQPLKYCMKRAKNKICRLLPLPLQKPTIRWRYVLSTHCFLPWFHVPNSLLMRSI